MTPADFVIQGAPSHPDFDRINYGLHMAVISAQYLIHMFLELADDLMLACPKHIS